MASDRDIYRLIEHSLRNSDRPLTCPQLMDIDIIRETAMAEFRCKNVQDATNRLSNALGEMWRRGVINRCPATPDGVTVSKARFAYTWPSSESPPIHQKDPLPEIKVVRKERKIVIEIDDLVISFSRK